ncbi:MAG TPA: phosphate regulon transcriptional regulator PhoB [Sulfuricella sp.]|nr:phosphate regulon transcriptional regulator PhoB [Sulfuricella sp.]
MSATILVVEDEPAICELVALNLKQAGHRHVVAGSAEQALVMMREGLPDMILLDWMLPGMSGVEFARRIKADARTRAIPIIMLTARGEEQDRITGLETGADDYVTKPFSPRELNARIKTVLRRLAPHVAGGTVEVMGLRLDSATHRVTGKDQPIKMGPTEFRLLHLLMTHPDRVYSRTQVLDQVWEGNVIVEDRTVDVHIRRLRRVLEATGHDRLIQTVRGVGYRFSAQMEG